MDSRRRDPAGLLALLPHLNALDCGFVYDDEGQILENDNVSPTQPWWKPLTLPLWPESSEAALYRPVVSFANGLQLRLHGPQPLPFHLLNVILHVIVSLLALAVLRHLRPDAPGWALAVASIFALHPIHTEAVTGIVGRAEVLAALFGLAAYWLWLRAADAGRTSAAAAGGMALAMALAMGSKESAAGWILLLALHRLGILGDGRRGLSWADAAVGAGFGLYLGLRCAVLGRLLGLTQVGFIENPIFGAPLDQRILTAGKVIARGLGLLVWPRHLSPDYSYDAIAIETSWLSPAGLFLVLCLGAAIWFIRRGKRLPVVAWGLGLYGACLLPASNLFFPVGTIMAERLLYLPSLGMLAALIWGLRATLRAMRRPGTFPVLIAIALLPLGARTWQRNQDWKSNLSLFTAAKQVEPRSVKILSNLGAALSQAGHHRAAIPEYERALDIAPDHLASLRGLGETLTLAGSYDRAETVLRRALERAPDDGKALRDLGNLLLEVDRPAEASEIFRRRLASRPGAPDGLVGLASALYLMKDYDAAAETWEEAFDASGRPIELGRHLVAAQIQAGRYDAARANLRDFLTIEPRAAHFHHQLAVLHLRTGSLEEEGLRAAREAVRLDPQPKHVGVLVRHLLARGRCAEARDALELLKPEERAELEGEITAACGEKGSGQ